MGLSAAYNFIARGWSVVPIPKGEKHPMIKWDSYKTKRATADELKGWIVSEGEGSNVGIITGAISGLVVVDADGPEAVAELQRRGVASPLRVFTSKGQHLYFAHPGVPVTGTVRIWGEKGKDGIDIRGDGNLVVAPPSIHASGRVYQWMGNPQCALPVYNPAWFAVAGSSSRRPPDWMGQALAGLGAGNRNATFAAVAGRLYRDGWDAAAILATLSSHARLVDFPVEELQTVVKSVGRYHPAAISNVMSPAALLAYSKEVEWIVPGVFPKQSSCILGGMQGLGKTWLLLDLAVSVASGQPWLGTFQVNQGSVLYVDEESAPQLMKYRLRKLLNGKPEINPANLPIEFRIGGGLNFSNPESRGQFARELRAKTPSVVIMDSLVRVHGVEENNASEMKLFFAEVKKLADELGITFIFADHVSKMAVTQDPKSQRDPSSNDLRGSNEKGAFADAVLSLYMKDGGLVVHHTKARWAEAVAPFGVRIEDTDGRTTKVTGSRYDA